MARFSKNQWSRQNQTKIKLFKQFPNQNVIILVYNNIIIVPVCMSWGSKPRPYDYESDALSLSYRPIWDMNEHTISTKINISHIIYFNWFDHFIKQLSVYIA